jgi:uncharacterized protein (TIGR02598 family)
MKQNVSTFDRRPRRKRRAAGFTLVEVMIAIGVLACAVLPLVGLLPHGAETLRVAIRQNAEAHIQQEILGRLSTTDWDQTQGLTDFDQTTWYFNDHGAPVTNASAALYTVCLEVSDSTLPGAVASNYYLRTVVLKVTDRPAAARPFEDPAKFRRYVATLAKMDK